MINPFPHNDICNGIIVYLLRASAKIIFQNYIKLHALHYAACFHWLWKPKAAADRAVIRMISSRLPLWNSVRVALRTIAAFSCSKSVSFVVAKKCAERLASRSEEHTSELQSLMRISYAVFCLKKKKKKE